MTYGFLCVKHQAAVQLGEMTIRDISVPQLSILTDILHEKHMNNELKNYLFSKKNCATLFPVIENALLMQIKGPILSKCIFS